MSLLLSKSPLGQSDALCASLTSEREVALDQHGTAIYGCYSLPPSALARQLAAHDRHELQLVPILVTTCNRSCRMATQASVNMRGLPAPLAADAAPICYRQSGFATEMATLAVLPFLYP